MGWRHVTARAPVDLDWGLSLHHQASIFNGEPKIFRRKILKIHTDIIRTSSTTSSEYTPFSSTQIPPCQAYNFLAYLRRGMSTKPS
jgi:hypothetical protein